MALIFERIQTDGIAALSYLVGDDSVGVAAVFDPRPDVDCYLQLAREKQVSITRIFETHIHADFVTLTDAIRDRASSDSITMSAALRARSPKILRGCWIALSQGPRRRRRSAPPCGSKGAWSCAWGRVPKPPHPPARRRCVVPRRE